MNQYKYILDPSSKKFKCPGCNRLSFVRFVNSQNKTEYYDNENIGRCDHESQCGYFEKPDSNTILNGVVMPDKPMVLIPDEILKATQKGYENNQFIQNLLKNVKYPYLKTDIEKVIELYKLGTIEKGYLKGGISLPYIDENNLCRAIQVKTFDIVNHTKETGFIHAILFSYYRGKGEPIPQWITDYQDQVTKVSCLFGAHLLPKYPNNPIILVEAPKTAIIGTLTYGMPDNENKPLCLAVFNLSSMKDYKMKALAGRKVVLYPDLSPTGKAYRLWQKQINQIAEKYNIRYTISDLLEKNAKDYERYNCNDLADYLLNLNWCDFRKKPEPQIISKPPEPPEPLNKPEPPEQIPIDNYTKLLAKNPLLAKLVNRFDCAIPLKAKEPLKATEPETNEHLSFEQLKQLAFNIIGENNHLHKSKIQNFEKILKAGLIIESLPLVDNFHLKNSYPF